MTQRELDVSSLPPYSILNASSLFLGQVLACIIEASLFFVLIATYFYLRLNVDVWPPPSTRKLDVLLPALAFVPLAFSCVASYIASEAAKTGSRAGMIAGLGANFCLGLIFLLMRYLETQSFPFKWSSDAHGSIVWSILFLHGYDMAADLLMTLVLLVWIAVGNGGPKQRIGVHVDSVIWYFLSGIWVVLFAVIYLSPRMLGGVL